MSLIDNTLLLAKDSMTPDTLSESIIQNIGVLGSFLSISCGGASLVDMFKVDALVSDVCSRFSRLKIMFLQHDV